MKYAACKHILRCLHINGKVRYELPAILIEEQSRYILYHRPHPEVVHHAKKKTFFLPHPELILVGNSETHHCLSIALDANNRAVNMYVNINLPPKAYVNGYEWYDLEIDIKLTRGVDDRWRAIIVDVEEFEKSDLNLDQRQIALNEVNSLLQEIHKGVFPFDK